MKRWLLIVGVGIGIAAVALYAQPPGSRGPGRQGPPGFTLMDALDVNKDGKISANEMDNAAATLKKLDKDSDGKLSTKEIGWPPEGGFRGRGGERGGGPPGFFGGFFGGGGPQAPQGRPSGDDDADAPKNRPAK